MKGREATDGWAGADRGKASDNLDKLEDCKKESCEVGCESKTRATFWRCWGVLCPGSRPQCYSLETLRREVKERKGIDTGSLLLSCSEATSLLPANFSLLGK